MNQSTIGRRRRYVGTAEAKYTGKKENAYTRIECCNQMPHAVEISL